MITSALTGPLGTVPVDPIGKSNPTRFRTLHPDQLSRLKDIDIQFKILSPDTIDTLIKDVKAIHPSVRPEDAWKKVSPKIAKKIEELEKRLKIVESRWIDDGR